MLRAFVRVGLLALAIWAGGASVGEIGQASAQILKPDQRWLTFETEHFRVHFPDGLEQVARRAAGHAERSHALLSEELIPPPGGIIDLVVADNVDFANGTATPFPRNRIVVYAHPPASEASLSNYDDWLGLVVLHELVHIFHLSEAGGIWPVVRTVLGRNPASFPHAFTPPWLIEGLATYAESRYTGAGRVRGSLYEMYLRTAVLDGDIGSIDRTTLEPPTWPGGVVRYLHGAFFIDHLAGRFGPEAVSQLIHSVGRRLVPYRLDAGARDALGTSFSSAWEVWTDSLRVTYSARADSLSASGLTIPEVLTTEGRLLESPRFAPDGSGILFTASTGRGAPGLMLWREGRGAHRIREVSSLGAASWRTGAPSGGVHAQLDFTDPYTYTSDLYGFDLDGASRRITREARIWEPDVHPDNRRAIAVGSAPGTNRLVRVDLGDGTVTPLTDPDLDIHWSTPRFSPTGDRIAVSRWRPSERFEVVVLDTVGIVIDRVPTGGGINGSPSWSPDGRYILFTSDQTGIPNLFGYDTETGRLHQITQVLTGAFHPDVSPDGQWIAFTYYLGDGYRLARIPFDPPSWRMVPTEGPARSPDEVATTFADASSGGAARGYSAWPSVLPTWWTPVATGGSSGEWSGVGLRTGGQDIIERHAWDLDLVAYPTRSRLDLGLGYRYRGLGNPVLDLAVTQDWTPQSGLSSEGNELARRDRRIESALTFNRRRWRSLMWGETGLELADVDFIWRRPIADPASDVELPLDVGVSAGIGFSSVRGYALSLGPQEGFRTSLRTQFHHFLSPVDDDGARRNYWRITSRTAAFRGWDVSGFAPSVFAARLDMGMETSAAAPGFGVGGLSATGSSISLAGGLSGNAAHPIRGYPPGFQRGNRVASASLEYRFPILLLERGYRLFPLAMNRIWGDVFLDAGTAWCSGICRTSARSATPDPVASIGAEVVLDLRVAFNADLPLRIGFARPLNLGGAASPGHLYLRLGRSF